jgi:hypothetical protein
LRRNAALTPTTTFPGVAIVVVAVAVAATTPALAARADDDDGGSEEKEEEEKEDIADSAVAHCKTFAVAPRGSLCCCICWGSSVGPCADED